MKDFISTTDTNAGTKQSLQNRARRKRKGKRAVTSALPKRHDFRLETLESRLLLSANLIGVPDFIEQGPRITSYNVCYTKLLRKARPSSFVRRVRRAL